MATEKVLRTFLDGNGVKHVPGDDVPDDSPGNIDKFRNMGLIGPAPTEKVEKPKRKPAGKKAEK